VRYLATLLAPATRMRSDISTADQLNCSDCDKRFLQRRGPVYPNTYVENVAGQVRPLIRERLPAHGVHRPEPP
jgi:hypothetical protein